MIKHAYKNLYLRKIVTRVKRNRVRRLIVRRNWGKEFYTHKRFGLKNFYLIKSYKQKKRELQEKKSKQIITAQKRCYSKGTSKHKKYKYKFKLKYRVKKVVKIIRKSRDYKKWRSLKAYKRKSLKKRKRRKTMRKKSKRISFILKRANYSLKIRNLITKKKRKLIERHAVITKPTKMQRLVYNYSKKRRKKTRKKSYFRKYFWDNRRRYRRYRHRRYKKILRRKTVPRFRFFQEYRIFTKLRRNLERYEWKRSLYAPKKRKDYQKPLSQRFFSFGRVYLTHRRRNTFAVIKQCILNKGERLIWKISCGTNGYEGPKRKTNYARRETIKETSIITAQLGLTSIDLIFPARIGRVFTHILRALKDNLIYVRYIIVPKRRAHGVVRKKKPRRTGRRKKRTSRRLYRKW